MDKKQNKTDSKANHKRLAGPGQIEEGKEATASEMNTGLPKGKPQDGIQFRGGPTY